jgi:hypothetical protein
MGAVKVYAANFWKGAFRADFFEYILNQIGDYEFEVTQNADTADLFFNSVFGSEHTPPDRTIFYTGENIRPDFRRARYALSFETDNWGDKNFYLPFWMIKTKWLGRDDVAGAITHYHGTEPLLDLERLTVSRSPLLQEGRTKFCALICSNPETLRMNLVSELQRYKAVDVFGPAVGRPLLRPKSEILREYRFCLCPENSYYPGYVTEKLPEAYLSGLLPIYFGGIPKSGLFNERAFLNYADDFNINKLIATIVALDTIPSLYESVYREPLFNFVPRISGLVSFLKCAVGAILSK